MVFAASLALGRTAEEEKLSASTEAVVSAQPPRPAPAFVEPSRFSVMLAGQYIKDGTKSTINGSSGLLGYLVLDDSLGLGSLVGLPAGSVKYKLGMGGFYVEGNGGLKAVPVYAGGLIYLPSWWSDPQTLYITGGLNYVIYDNGRPGGKLGGDIFLGLVGDLGLCLGKTGLELGYSVIRSNTLTSKGFCLSLFQMFVL